MMHVITARNVNSALEAALWWFKVSGVEALSRNGRVLMCPTPVATVYTNPTERVLFSALRDANPFFHLFESIWMLAGRDDVAFPARYAKQLAEYSDNGATLHGAYGYRWRNHFGIDQIDTIIDMLKVDPTTRRAVLAMWDTEIDLDAKSKDIPCNTQIYFSAVLGKLDMTVCCRSNDAVWGCYGANAVHFSMLQQFIAEATGLPLGTYTQISNNLHLYVDRPDVQRLYDSVTKSVNYVSEDLYIDMDIVPDPLIQPHETMSQFMLDVERFVNDPTATDFQTEFFCTTVAPMQRAHDAYKADDFEKAISESHRVKSVDWAFAANLWLQRRKEKRDAK